MLKKTMTYTDFEGVTRTEDFYFNLTQAEVAEMEMSVDGGLTKLINRITAAKEGRQIINLFKDFVLRAMELATDSKFAAEFVAGVIPTPKDGGKQLGTGQAQLTPGSTT